MAPLRTRDRRLSRRLKKETRTEHDLAEASRFAKLFFQGRFDAGAYAQSLGWIELVYTALEEGLEANDVLAPFQRRAIYRGDVIRDDRRHYGADTPLVDTPYAARIRDVATRDPFRLLGHFYVRYFAEMSGVAKVAPMAHRLLGIPADQPLKYFQFPKVPDLRAAKNELRGALDDVPPAFHDVILDEARRSFTLHRELVDGLLTELEARFAGSALSAE